MGEGAPERTYHRPHRGWQNLAGCALAHKACRDVNTAQYVRLTRLLRELTIATSQLPIQEWHGVIGDATLADAILDRLVHNAYKINLRGESMRKRQAKLTGTATSE